MKMRKILLIFFSIVLGVSLFDIGRQFYLRAKDTYVHNKLVAVVEETNYDDAEEIEVAQDVATEEVSILEEVSKYQLLADENSDFVGWLSIADTKLSYPVMYTPDNPEYYLYKDFYQAYSIAGTPFVGEGCSVNPPSDNILIYGHNLANGEVFQSLLAYQDADFWNLHPIIEFDTVMEEQEYAVFAAFYEDVTIDNGHFPFYESLDGKTEEEYMEFVATCKEKSVYDAGVDVVYGDELLTLVTCSYHVENGRFVVVCRKIN